MKFNDYREVTVYLVGETVAALPDLPNVSVEEGYSNISCSAYVNVDFWELDEDGDQSETFGACKVRFSDHRDFHGSDLTIRFDGELANDELGNVQLDDQHIAEMVTEAVAFIENQLKEQAND